MNTKSVIVKNMKFFNKNIFYLLIFNLHLINCAITTTLKPDFGENFKNSSVGASVILPSSSVSGSSGQISCLAAFQARGFTSTDIPNEPIKGRSKTLS